MQTDLLSDSAESEDEEDFDRDPDWHLTPAAVAKQAKRSGRVSKVTLKKKKP